MGKHPCLNCMVLSGKFSDTKVNSGDKKNSSIRCAFCHRAPHIKYPWSGRWLSKLIRIFSLVSSELVIACFAGGNNRWSWQSYWNRKVLTLSKLKEGNALDLQNLVFSGWLRRYGIILFSFFVWLASLAHHYIICALACK